jgi:CRP-like cAMP-binding protein
MRKRLTLNVSDSKSIRFDHPDLKNIGRSINHVTEKNSSKQLTGNKDPTFRLIGYIKKQTRRSSVRIINPFDELIDIIIKELNLISTKDHKDDTILANFLFEKVNDNYINGRKVKLVELIFHLLKKNQKNDNEILILKLYFTKMEKLVSLLIPLKINISDMLSKLVCQIKCEKRAKNTILFKAGDTGEKLYMLLKGNVGILIKKEKNIECTPLEYIKLLILLYLYQEEALLIEIICKNKNTINIEENGIICLLNIFKIYYFLRENQRLTKNYNSLFDFIQAESKLRAFIQNRYNYSPMLSFDQLNYEKTTIEQLFNFYCRKIKEINKNLKFGLTGSALIANFIKRQIKSSLANKPATMEELLNNLKPYDEGKKKFKNEQEYYQKISYFNEISHYKILSTSEEKYIQRLDPQKLLESIRQDTSNYHNPDDIISELSVKIKASIYYEINQLYEGNIFGELALSDPKNRRSATVITKEDCYFGTLIKQVYDLSLKAAQEKLRLRNVLFFTRGPIFKGLSNNIFLNKFFYTFKKRAYQKGDVLFRKGEKVNSVIFVERGELELSRNMTMAEITNIINSLGGILDDKYLTFLCNTYYQLHKFYYNHKHNIKFCVLKDKEIIGLDDLTIDDMNIFDCKCVSTEKTELYEIDYNTFKKQKNTLK